ncbi:MAG: hypothetical protein EB101_07945 [Chitinophagia bacterium]|nr:hypothetical protein [Chitinophagia bacterium]
MNDRLLKISATLFPVDIEGNTYATSEKIMEFAELIVRESIVDFYRRYLDLESEEDITEQVNRYVKDHFGVE